MIIDVKDMNYRIVNEHIRPNQDITLINVLGQRFIGAGMKDQSITIDGIPGNALGAYLNGADIIVKGNGQDAVGDTMNDGKIIIHGNIGDAAGYAMRGGKIYVKGNAGYRAGIHMKAYQNKQPLMIIGGSAGSFLGEYQAGGTIIVLGLSQAHRILGYFPCTGMHGGRMFLRSKCTDINFPDQVTARPITEEDRAELQNLLTEYCSIFNHDIGQIMNHDFTLVTPDSKNPYRQMYVAN